MNMMNGLPSVTTSSEVKYPPNVANNRNAGGSTEVDTEKLYEPKPNKKIVRIFTVILYMFSVSLGAILLSLYYIFIWRNPLNSCLYEQQELNTTLYNECKAHLPDPTLPPKPNLTEEKKGRTARKVPTIVNHQNVEFLYVDSPPISTQNIKGDHVGSDDDKGSSKTGRLEMLDSFKNMNTDALQAFMKKRSLPTGSSKFTSIRQP